MNARPGDEVRIPPGIAQLLEDYAEQGYTGVQYDAQHRHRAAIERVAARVRLLAFPLIGLEPMKIQPCMADAAGPGSAELRQAAGLMLSQMFATTLDRGVRLVAGIERRGWQLVRRPQ